MAALTSGRTRPRRRRRGEGLSYAEGPMGAMAQPNMPRQHTAEVILRMRLLACCATLCLVGLCCPRARSANYYDGRSKNWDGGVRGARAYITTAPPPNLHGGVTSCVWVMIAKDDASRLAQTGYCLDSGQTTLHRFAQWDDNNGVRRERQSSSAPASGDHQWELSWDAAHSRYSFKYDGVEWWNTSEFPATWAGGNGQFAGEVLETTAVQMMGDVNHQVTFSSFELLVQSCGWYWAGIWPNDSRNDSPAQWAQLVSQANGYFTIYDTTP